MTDDASVSPGPPTNAAAPTIGGVDIRVVSGCTCMRLRKAARRATQIYEARMQSCGLAIGQFGVLATLFGAHAMTGERLSVGALAEWVGVDPTTLKRALDPLVTQALVVSQPDPSDRRVRRIAITASGSAKLAAAVPLWVDAQRALQDLLGDARKTDLDRSVEAALQSMRETAHDASTIGLSRQRGEGPAPVRTPAP